MEYIDNVDEILREQKIIDKIRLTWDEVANPPQNDQPLLLQCREEGVDGTYVCLGYYDGADYVAVYSDKAVGAIHWFQFPPPPKVND